MFDNVKSMEAFRQKVDFCGGNIVKIIRRGTDIDFVYRLANKRMAAIEVKKNTMNHTVDTIINSSQWEDYRDLCKDNTYLIYVTHDNTIKETEDIPLDALTVRYVEVNKQSIEFPDNINLETVANYLGSLNTYYIRVRYKNGQIEYALKHPINEKWSIPNYWAASICFMTEDAARNYINTRYEKDFNQEYIYEIWHIDENGQHNKITEISYSTN